MNLKALGERCLQSRSCSVVERQALSVCGAPGGAGQIVSSTTPSGPAAIAPRLPVQACRKIGLPTPGWTGLCNALAPETL